ncbi:MAG: extracellular solute-binding protein [Oscillospiraceae bacterium]|nr:extracellular solute-binding protein [Oscillospiraceae bacterium]
MKLYFNQKIPIILALMILLSTVAACKNDNYVDGDDDYIFVSEIISLTELSKTVGDISNIVIGDDIIYFVATMYEYNNTMFHKTSIYSAKFDDHRLIDVTELKYYVTNQIPSYAEGGGANITAMCLDDNGYLWVAEQGEYFRFNVPVNFNEDEYELWDFYEELPPFNTLRKLDASGDEILYIEVNSLFDDHEDSIYTLNSDNFGNIYLSTLFSIIVFGDDGEFLFRISESGLIHELIRLRTGQIAFRAVENHLVVLQLIDINEKALGETISLHHSTRAVFSGGEDYLFLFSDNNSLYGVETDIETKTWLFDWSDNDISSQNVSYLKLLSNEHIILVTDTIGISEIIVLSLTLPIKNEDRIVLTLAAVAPTGTALTDVISRFNRTSLTHRIELIDYYPYDIFGSADTVFPIALERLTLDITIGNVPDIMYLTQLPFYEWVDRGLFEDLYPFIDEDPDISRNDLVESVFRAHEIDGSLYSIFDNFAFYTMVGLTSVVGEAPGWTMDEFNTLLKANPQADKPFGAWQSKEGFLRFFVSLSKDEYINWETRTAHFDSSGFADLLLHAYAMDVRNTETGWHLHVDFSDWDWVNKRERITTGRQLVDIANFERLANIAHVYDLFGAEITFIGLPTEQRTISTLISDARYLAEGHKYNSLNLAITARSKNKDAAWEFIRTIITEDYQTQLHEKGGYLTFPTNKAVLESILVRDMDNPWFDLSKSDIDRVMFLIDNIKGMTGLSAALWNIISEGAIDFWNGRTTLDDTVRIIQSRASIYVAERAG